MKNNKLHNLLQTLMTSLVSAFTGFGFFWFSYFIGNNVFLSMFSGMMISSLMFNAVQQMYPLKKDAKTKSKDKKK